MLYTNNTSDFADIHKHVRTFTLDDRYAHLSYGDYMKHMSTLAPHLDNAVHTLRTQYCRRQIHCIYSTHIEPTIPYDPTVYAHLLSIV